MEQIERKIFLRKKAITVIELLKGHTPEQREMWSNSTKTCEELAGDILELTVDVEVFQSKIH